MRLLKLVDPLPPTEESVAGRIGRLSRAGAIPREVAAFMRSITEMRNVAEYQGKELSSAENRAIAAAWGVIEEWGKTIEGKV